MVRAICMELRGHYIILGMDLTILTFVSYSHWCFWQYCRLQGKSMHPACSLLSRLYIFGWRSCLCNHTKKRGSNNLTFYDIRASLLYTTSLKLIELEHIPASFVFAHLDSTFPIDWNFSYLHSCAFAINKKKKNQMMLRGWVCWYFHLCFLLYPTYFSSKCFL